MSQSVNVVAGAERGQLWLCVSFVVMDVEETCNERELCLVLWQWQMMLVSVPLLILSILSSDHQQEGPHIWPGPAQGFFPLKQSFSLPHIIIQSIWKKTHLNKNKV